MALTKVDRGQTKDLTCTRPSLSDSCLVAQHPPTHSETSVPMPGFVTGQRTGWLQ